jgi:hypothetical protein
MGPSVGDLRPVEDARAKEWALVTVTAGVGALAFARLVEVRRSPTGA